MHNEAVCPRPVQEWYVLMCVGSVYVGLVLTSVAPECTAYWTFYFHCWWEQQEPLLTHQPAREDGRGTACEKELRISNLQSGWKLKVVFVFLQCQFWTIDLPDLIAFGKLARHKWNVLMLIDRAKMAKNVASIITGLMSWSKFVPRIIPVVTQKSLFPFLPKYFCVIMPVFQIY